ncbi:hypothetical protein [Streptomyces fradiae]|uniref:mycothiol-dependent nitroreductase Rv2466c family protein n=1 Tax=Streptomyces fradiae TaxID=1906 RepID=UPI003522DE66
MLRPLHAATAAQPTAPRGRHRDHRSTDGDRTASFPDCDGHQQFDRFITDSHHEAFDEVALDVGSLVLRTAGTAPFDPVVTPASRGEATGRLWGGLLATATTDGFIGSHLQGGADQCARTSPSRPIVRGPSRRRDGRDRDWVRLRP